MIHPLSNTRSIFYKHIIKDSKLYCIGKGTYEGAFISRITRNASYWSSRRLRSWKRLELQRCRRRTSGFQEPFWSNWRIATFLNAFRAVRECQWCALMWCAVLCCTPAGGSVLSSGMWQSLDGGTGEEEWRNCQYMDSETWRRFCNVQTNVKRENVSNWTSEVVSEFSW